MDMNIMNEYYSNGYIRIYSWHHINSSIPFNSNSFQCVVARRHMQLAIDLRSVGLQWTKTGDIARTWNRDTVATAANVERFKCEI